MKVLLTGGSGLIGLPIARRLADHGIEVHATSRRTPSRIPAGVRWHVCDLMDRPAMENLIATVGPSHLIHCAWCVTPGTVWWDVSNLDWCGATFSLVRAFQDSGGKRALLLGTCAEYDWSTGKPCDEEATPLVPASLYGQAKVSCRALLQTYAERTGLSFTWARLFNIYGPGEVRQRLVAAAITSLLSGKSFNCTDATQQRDFIHVDDLADAICNLLVCDVTGTFNLGSGQPITIRQLLEEIGNQLGCPSRIVFGALPRPPGEPDVLYPVLDRLRASSTWQPTVGLAEGVAQTIGWWRKQEVLEAFST